MPDHARPPFAFRFVENYDVQESTFFRQGNVLPTLDEVRVRAITRTRGKLFLRPPVQYYNGLGLLVKYGHQVSIAEAHCLMFLREHAPTVPVPELYGWRRDKRQTFIYMQLIDGHRASGAHSTTGVYPQIKAIVDTLKAIPQTLVSPEPFVGHVNGTHLQDWFITNSATPAYEAGPFSSVTEFHDWLANQHGKPAGSDIPPETHAAYRAGLLEDSPIALSHGGLTLDNIIVSRPQPNGNETILAVVDWSQAGWYPSYWDSLKMQNGGDEGDSEEVLFCLEACDFFYYEYSVIVFHALESMSAFTVLCLQEEKMLEKTKENNRRGDI